MDQCEGETYEDNTSSRYMNRTLSTGPSGRGDALLLTLDKAFMGEPNSFVAKGKSYTRESSLTVWTKRFSRRRWFPNDFQTSEPKLDLVRETTSGKSCDLRLYYRACNKWPQRLPLCRCIYYSSHGSTTKSRVYIHDSKRKTSDVDSCVIHKFR